MQVTHIYYEAPNGARVTAGVHEIVTSYRAEVAVDSTRLAHAHFETQDEASDWADKMARCYAFEVHA